jgi:hypothetical protein
VAFGLAAVESVPFEACHLSALLLVSSHALSPKIALLVGIFLAGAAFNHLVQFLFDQLAARNVH